MNENKSTCIRCKNCTQVIKTFPVTPTLPQVEEIKTLRNSGHRSTVEPTGNKERCAGKQCYETLGIEQLVLTFN